MFKLNNKGQSLIMFVFTIPIFLFILVIIVDIGNIIVNKQSLNNINYLAVSYGLDNIDIVEENDLIDMITLNNDNLDDIDINVNDNVIEITIKQKIEGLVLGVFDTNIYEVVSKYSGTIVDNEKKIERVK